MNIIMHPIGIIRSPYKEPRDIPIQGIFKPDVEARVELNKQYSSALKDLEDFSHAILLYHFHRSNKEHLQGTPFLEDDQHGIFAIRSPHRPNHIGLSIVKVLSIEGNILHFSEVDILDGTPLLDIKPYVKYFDARDDVVSGWVDKHFEGGRAPDRTILRQRKEFMAIVTLRDIHVAFGMEVVLDKLNLQLNAGEKVGMVGANGSGKSTILKLIVERIKPDMGKLIKQRGLRIGYLAQEATFSGQRTVLEEMHSSVENILKLQKSIQAVSHEMESLSGSALKAKMKRYDRLCHDFEIAGGYAYETRILTTLAGIGIEPELHQAKTSALSGGQLSRLGLAQVLMLETDLLLLDEPTNHLDLQATEWLEKFLANYNGAAVIISHDRSLLDKIACKIIEVESRQAKVWNGNYTNYVQTKETVRLQQEREHVKRVEMVERTLDFIARNKDQEGMRKTARGRKTQLNRLLKENPDYLDKPSDDKEISFAFGKSGKASNLVLRCEGLGKSFGELKLFSDLTFDLLRGERLGVTGPNGTGKSTLLKLALAQLEPSAGAIRMGKTLKIGYLDQHGDVLDSDRSALEEASSTNTELTSESVRNQLGAFLFTGDDVFKKCGELSGGQRNRLMLCKLVLSRPDVLVMDEPTNHLDIASREMLETALEDFAGAMIVVSHDRYFLDRIADKLLVIGTDSLGARCLGQTQFVATTPVYSHYASLVRKRMEQQQQDRPDRAGGRRRRRPASAGEKPRAKTPEDLRRFNKYSVEQLEDMITYHEQELVVMKEQFGDAEIYKNPEQLARLQTTFEAKTAELDLLYRAYERRIE